MDIKKTIEGLLAIGYSQIEIASMTGIPQSTLSRIINGKIKNPRLSTEQWEKVKALV
jgi:transcriptional regulator with XRE-family HTH domain